MSPINKEALIQILGWRLTCDKPVSEAMLAWRIYAPLVLNKLTQTHYICSVLWIPEITPRRLSDGVLLALAHDGYELCNGIRSNVYPKGPMDLVLVTDQPFVGTRICGFHLVPLYYHVFREYILGSLLVWNIYSLEQKHIRFAIRRPKSHPEWYCGI